MGFCLEPHMVELNRFKRGGKWYDTRQLDMRECYDDVDIHKAIAHCCDAQGINRVNFIIVVLEPYHINARPTMLMPEVGL